MTANPATIARRERDLPRSASPGSFRFAWVLAGGATALALAAVLVALVALHDVRGQDTWHQVIRLAAMTPLLPLGALMVARLPRNPIGWLLCGTPIGVGLSVAAEEYATYSHFVARLPAEIWVGWVGEWVSGPMLSLVSVAPLLYPSGQLPSRRWRPALWAGIAAPVLVGLQGLLGPGEDLAFIGNPFTTGTFLNGLSDAGGLGWFLMLPAAGAGVAALAVRQRSADVETREQLRLLRRATVVVAVAFAACLVGSFLTPRAFDLGALAAYVSLAFLGCTMAVAILRHRMYGLDVYVNRALVYAMLSLVLGGLYVGAVVGIGRLLGQDVSLGVALPATALVAVASHPLRVRLQRSVNRLLHGQRDEPYAAISALGRRLGEAMAPAEVLPVMASTIADALRVPYVAVELAAEPGRPAAVQGTPAAGIALRLPLLHGGGRVGTLVVGARTHGESLSDSDRRLLETFADHAGAAASAVALSTEVQRSREQLVSAREEERRRLRGDLHDGLGPTLAGAVLTIEAARRTLAHDPQRADELLDQVAANLENTVADVRRLVYGLRPPALDQLGLVGALRQQAAALAFQCEITAPDPLPHLPAAVEVATFRIAQEALTNVARHADARGCRLTLTVAEAVRLEIRDDGRGLAANRPAGVGLTSMRDRAAELGGTLDIRSSPAAGTVVTARIPLSSTPAVPGES